MQLASQQIELDRKIQELIEELVNLFRIIAGASSIEWKDDSFTQVIDELLDFITECSIFVHEYIRRSFIGKQAFKHILLPHPN